MNKRIINLIVAVLLATASTFGSNIITVPDDGTKTFVVDTKIWKSEYMSISIKAVAGDFMFKDTYSTKNGKRFSLENLPNGKYIITMANDLKSTSQTFVITNTEVILESETVTIFKPIIEASSEFIDLNYLAKGVNTSISIYDANREVYSIDFDNQMTINKRFDINNLPKGNYTVSVSSDDVSYSKSFHK